MARRKKTQKGNASIEGDDIDRSFVVGAGDVTLTHMGYRV